MSVGRAAVPRLPCRGLSHLTCGAQLFKIESLAKLARRKVLGEVVGGRGGSNSEILQIQNIPLNLIEIVHLGICYVGVVVMIKLSIIKKKATGISNRYLTSIIDALYNQTDPNSKGYTRVNISTYRIKYKSTVVLYQSIRM